MTQPALRRWQMIALALPALPMSALTIPLVSFLPEFYANTIGLNLGTVGTVFMIVRLLDLGVDPVLGSFMDRTRSRWGRYKPWLVAGVPVIVLGTWFLMFAKPGAGPAYLTAWLLISYLGFSMIVLAQLALTAAQTHGYRERSLAFGWWQAAYTLGILCVVALPMLASPQAGNNRVDVMHGMGMVVMIATPLTVLITCFGIHDASAAAVERAHAGLIDYLQLLRRRSTRLLLGGVLLFGLSTGISAALGLIFFTAVKQLPLSFIGVQMIILFGTAIGAAPLWVKFSNRVGKHRAYAIGGSVNIAFFVANIFLPAGHALPFYLISAISGFAYAAANQMPRAMLADINDEELLDHGVDRTGLLYALITGIDKIGFAVAVGIAFWLLDLLGYVPAAGRDNPAVALHGVTLLYCVLSSLLTAAAALLVLRYPLTAERHAQIRRELDRRVAVHGATADEPLFDDASVAPSGA